MITRPHGPGSVAPTPDVFAAVMATGILSIAAHNHRYRWISDTLGVLATTAMVLLIVLVCGVAGRRGAIWDLGAPDVTLRLFSFVAACAVLDSRLSAHPIVASLLCVVAAAAWLLLAVLTVRNMAARSWTALRDQAHGAWELGSVGTSGLVIVTAKLARYSGQQGWLWLAVPVWAAAIGVYGLMTWLLLWRSVAERRGAGGYQPDSWILMGALAIATLAGDSIYGVAPGWLAGPVRAVTVLTWVVASGWIPVLVYFMLHRVNERPGVLRFAGVWWSLVFPLGMYSVATDASAAELVVRSLQTISLVFFWDALAAWLIVVIAGLLRGGRWVRTSA